MQKNLHPKFPKKNRIQGVCILEASDCLALRSIYSQRNGKQPPLMPLIWLMYSALSSKPASAAGGRVGAGKATSSATYSGYLLKQGAARACERGAAEAVRGRRRGLAQRAHVPPVQPVPKTPPRLIAVKQVKAFKAVPKIGQGSLFRS